jgi:hypothetical protein
MQSPDGSGMECGGGAEAVLRILRGGPTDEEIAALLAVVAALGAGDRGARPAQRVQPRLRCRHGRHLHQHQYRSAGSWRGHQ